MKATLTFEDTRFMPRGALRISAAVENEEAADNWAVRIMRVLFIVYGPARLTLDDDEEKRPPR